VKRLLFIVALSLSCTCADAKKATTMKTSATDIVLTQGSVGSLSGARVGVMRVWEDTYELPDGTKKKGITARLAVEDPAADFVVGKGSLFTIKNDHYEVIAVEEGVLRRGTVTLRRKP
jgi:hypothetical protein